MSCYIPIQQVLNDTNTSSLVLKTQGFALDLLVSAQYPCVCIILSRNHQQELPPPKKKTDGVAPQIDQSRMGLGINPPIDYQSRFSENPVPPEV